MVKKFISGMLGKKKDSKKDIPDELPALAEDVVKVEKTVQDDLLEDKEKGVSDELSPVKEEKASKDQDPAAEGKKDKIPDELPPIADVAKKIEAKLSEEKEPANEEPLKAKEEEKAEIANVDVPAETEKTEENADEPKPAQIEERGFFSSLGWMIKHKRFDQKLMSENLFEKMRDNWYIKKSMIKENISSASDKEHVEKEILDKLEQLKRLENRWKAEKEFIEENKRILISNEREIVSKTEELRILLEELKFHTDVPADKYFFLDDEIVIKNMKELIKVFDVMDDKMFRKHVSDGRNDFANWIRYVIQNTELADRIQEAKTKEDIIKIFETLKISR